MISEESIINSFKEIFTKLDFSDKSMLPSEFAEKYIKLDSSISSLRQGKFSYDLTPYAKEIADCASPYHPSKMIAVMKGAQVGISQSIIVPVILWKIANDPGNMISLSANDGLSKDFVEKRIDPIIQRCFVKDLIKPSVIRKRNARTGDTSSSKEFAGGSIVFGGLQSVDNLGKQRSFQLGVFDDWEGAKIADKEQGNIFEIIQQRFSTSANTMKQYFISTPEFRPSNIENIYELGDKRKWNVPCPCCGGNIELIWNTEIKGEYFGILFDKDSAGNLIEKSVRYRCQLCGDEFKEKHKYEMNLSGVWIPTATPKEPGFYSYHLPCYAAAPGMYDWTHYAHRWLRIYDGNEKGDMGKLKAFKNLVMGEPWEQRKVKINENDLQLHVRDYEIGTIPSTLSENDGNDKIILLTLSADMNGTEFDARLDWELKANSASGSQYSIDHGSIGTYQPGQKALEKKNKGERDLWSYNQEDDLNVWNYLENEIMAKNYKADDGRVMKISIILIDSGHLTTLAYKFVEKYPGICYAVKGTDEDKYTKPSQDLKRYRESKDHPLLMLLEVDRYKDELSDMMCKEWDINKSTSQPSGYINYPTPNYQEKKYTIDFFAQLSVEEKDIKIDEKTGEVKGWHWTNPKKKANHFWDCSVYNLAARDIFMTNFIREYNKNVERKIEITWYNFSRIILNLLK